MKEIVGKAKIKQGSLAKHLVINNKKLNNKTEIVRKLNQFFANIGPKLATNILDDNNKLESYIPETEAFQTHSELTDNEFETAFKSHKKDKAPVFDSLHVIIVKSVIFKNSVKEE